MQDILLPLLVLNLLITFWLLRQHILRQGRRHKRRREFAEWRYHVDMRIKQFFESLVNQSDALQEVNAAMAAIRNDHYALNERIDGFSIYDIKAILAGQEKIQTLENAMEVFFKNNKQADHTLMALERRASKIELAINSIEDNINDFGRRFNTFDLVSKYNTEWQQKVERHMKATVEVSTNNSDWVAKIDADVLMIKNELDAIRSRLIALENPHPRKSK